VVTIGPREKGSRLKTIGHLVYDCEDGEQPNSPSLDDIFVLLDFTSFCMPILSLWKDIVLKNILHRYGRQGEINKFRGLEDKMRHPLSMPIASTDSGD
jgi:hypothetical protein